MHITPFKRHISALVLLTFTSLTLQPLQAVAQVKLAQAQATQTSAPSDDEQYAKLLEDIKETAKRGADKASKGQSTRDDTKALRSRKTRLEALEAKVDQSFAATEQDLISKNLPAEILARHRVAVADYKAKQAEFKQKIKALVDADDSEDETRRGIAMQDFSTFMEQNQKSKTHTPTDPNKLPFGTPDGKVRAPIETEQGFKTSLFSPRKLHGWQPYTLAAAGSLTGISLPASAGPTPSAADLAETEDVQLTLAIRAQATALNNNPVQIHNWVRNNIEFIPSYGSIQGADLTLQSKRGNAFDTASLEIALLRAAGIPARYAYGTVQMPAEAVMNWVGGVTKPEAAQSLLGQGGIPNVALVSGGKVIAFKLEHVWVEAYVALQARGNGKPEAVCSRNIRLAGGWRPSASGARWFTLRAHQAGHSIFFRAGKILCRSHLFARFPQRT
jgi:transglutaminase-like putative cysteine protease